MKEVEGYVRVLNREADIKTAPQIDITINEIQKAVLAWKKDQRKFDVLDQSQLSEMLRLFQLRCKELINLFPDYANIYEEIQQLVQEDVETIMGRNSAFIEDVAA